MHDKVIRYFLCVSDHFKIVLVAVVSHNLYNFVKLNVTIFINQNFVKNGGKYSTKMAQMGKGENGQFR